MPGYYRKSYSSKKTNVRRGLKKRLSRKSLVAGGRGHITFSQLPRAVRPELKKFDDSSWAAETIDNYAAPSVVTTLFNISAGSNPNNRIGNTIYCKRIMGRMIFHQSQSNDRSCINLAVVLDRQPDAFTLGAPSNATLWAQIFKDQSDNVKNLVTLTNVDNNRRFKILKRSTIILNAYLFNDAAGTGNACPAGKYMKFNVPINKKITYVGTGGNGVSAGCQVYVLAWSDQTSNTTQVTMTTRTYFSDD